MGLHTLSNKELLDGEFSRYFYTPLIPMVLAVCALLGEAARRWAIIPESLRVGALAAW